MSRLVLRNAIVFNALTGKLNENKTIIIKNNHINWVGPESSYDKEISDEIIDASGKTVLPGMIDTHIHIEIAHRFLHNFEREIFRCRDAMLGYLALKHAQDHLKSGFTTLRDCGSGTLAPASLRRVFARNIFPGPRLVVSQRTIGQWGNQEQFGPQTFIDTKTNLFGSPEVISGQDGVIHAVRSRKRDGADYIKTATTGGVLHGQDSKVELSLWNDEELEAMVKEAERLGMYVASHAHGTLGIHKAVQADVHTIEHGSLVSEETSDIMVQKGTYLIPTHSAISFFGNLSDEMKKIIPPEAIKKGQHILKSVIEKHKIAHEKGVTIALGTDAPVASDHGNSSRELTLMVKNIGMTPAEALQAATINAARALRMDDEVGSIETGKFADLIIVEGDPLEEIALLEKVENILHVIKDGRIMAQQGKLVLTSSG
ncbi:MAG: amidohydrolase family protein [Candidatus Hodarchaeales archaeon]